MVTSTPTSVSFGVSHALLSTRHFLPNSVLEAQLDNDAESGADLEQADKQTEKRAESSIARSEIGVFEMTA